MVDKVHLSVELHRNQWNAPIVSLTPTICGRFNGDYMSFSTLDE